MKGMWGCGSFGVLLLLAAPSLVAQTAPPGPEAQVMAVVDELFVAMRAADSATVRTLFHPELEKMFGEGFLDKLQAALVACDDPAVLDALDRDKLVKVDNETFAGIAAVLEKVSFD